MNWLDLAWRLPLAQPSRFDLGNGFRRAAEQNSYTDFLIVLGLFLVALIGAAAVAIYVNRREEPVRTPGRLFADLCRAHGFDRRTRRLLRKIAANQDLDHPSRLFLEPHRLDPAQLPPQLRRERGRLDAVKAKLFG